jgi:hypothetical protein
MLTYAGVCWRMLTYAGQCSALSAKPFFSFLFFAAKRFGFAATLATCNLFIYLSINEFIN